MAVSRVAVGLLALAVVASAPLRPDAARASDARATRTRAGAVAARPVAPVAPVASLIVGPAATVDAARAPALAAVPFAAAARFDRPTHPRLRDAIADIMPTGARTPQRRVRTTGSTTVPGFNGITEATAESTFPSDVNGSVSDSEVAQVVNQHLTVWRKVPPFAQVADASLATITRYTTQAIFDPRLVYDPLWRRWVATTDAFPQSASVQRFFFIVTKTPKAGGPYVVYSFNVAPLCGPGAFLDFPQLGLNQDAVVVTGNCFTGATYNGAVTFAVAKALLYNGTAFAVPAFAVSPDDDTLTPSLVFDQNPAIDMLTRNGPHLVRFTDPANGYYAQVADLGTVVGAPAPTMPRPAGQKGCTTLDCRIDTGDGRFVEAGVEIGTHLYNVATYGATGDWTAATPTWLDVDTTTASVNQFGTVSADACSDDFNASMTVANDGRAWLNWTSSDPEASPCGGTFVRQEIATRLPSDPAGTFPTRLAPFTSPAELVGDYDPNFSMQRWGDMSSIARDPVNTGVAWSWNQSVADATHWGTRAEKIKNS